ncbi:MAG: bifunctional alpha,alpha-trehalose-phosphate synthase (UDP-forming)/trehalose-phosphatase [Candidatus Eremiobacteraeota bacterium]|nr:bifunctional alpha,alpha-trehalose-phosphate synthase (UDP-forming)/trehalose-phosphatase [Candidatus Eremiobacteraeota bacterium]
MRLLVVSNRLSVTVNDEKSGKFTFSESAGGLATGLKGFLDAIGTSSHMFDEYLWVGWPGVSVGKKKQDHIKAELASKFRSHPVFLSAGEVEKFYSGFCNKTIWPLFHYFPVYTIYDESLWNHYKEANRKFMETILEVIEPDDTLWIHDYHLLLLPAMLRRKIPAVKVGFFLHIPFPTFEVFRLLPMKWRREILQGLLGADLIGFHTYSYTRYFLECVRNILGIDHSMGKLYDGERMVQADAFPISIDYRRFNEAARSPEVEDEIEKYRSILLGHRAILSMDRLDYSKGISNRLKGYEHFLSCSPEWRGKVVLILVVVPSRIKVEHYQAMKRQIDELVGKINGTYGSMEWTPVLYLYKSLSFKEIAALYSLSDIALITPLRDGMNLIAKEYVASRIDGRGVLVLSEMAGAAQELGEAILINPNNTEDMCGALKEALEMSEDDQKKRILAMQSRIMRYNIVAWAEDFLDSLFSLKEEQKKSICHMVTPSLRKQIVEDFRKAGKKILFLDYDGTLIPFSDHPLQAVPTPEVLELLLRLSSLPGTEVTIISGRDRRILSQWFDTLPVNLIAEHGVWTREKGLEWEALVHHESEWKLHLLPLLERSCDRLPGSFIENKEHSLVFHYRKSETDLSFLRVRELVADLVSYVANKNLHIVQGNKIVEVKNSGINKGVAAQRFLAKKEFGFILAIGDDQTDEDMFRAFSEPAYTIKVGMGSTQARYAVKDHRDVLNLLGSFADLKSPGIPVIGTPLKAR